MAGASHTLNSPPVWRLIAIAAYPALVLVSVWLDEPRLRALSMPLLALAAVGPAPTDTRWLLLMFGAVALAVMVIAWPALALWPPGLICLAVGAWFGLSLRRASMPAIERFARAIHESEGGHPPDDSGRWMRGWTLAWALLLTMLGLVTIALAAGDLAGWWFVWVALVIPFLVTACLLTEFWWRRRRFADHDHLTLRQFLTAMACIRPGQVYR
jgi:uncharacterized membrane protein